MKKIITLLFIFAGSWASAQFPLVCIPGSEVRKLTSTKVPGQEYELQILIPGGYKQGEKKYPVVYLMDSQWDFPLVKSVYGQQYFDGFVPGFILVGVTWGGTNPNPDSLRARDYTPTKEPRMIQSGGADQFLNFMEEELFPFIEKNYAASPANRTLMGCSLGGLFTIYTMLTRPAMFDGYIAASPAVGWDAEVLYKFEKQFADSKLTNLKRLYLTVGDVERGKPGFERFAQSLAALKKQNVSIRSKVLENTGHSGTKSETYSRGLQYVFEKRALEIGNETLSQYTGTYASANGDEVKVKNENNQLMFYYSLTTKYDLFAASETEFYSKSEFLNINFKKENGKVTGADLARFGGTQALKKIN